MSRCRKRSDLDHPKRTYQCGTRDIWEVAHVTEEDFETTEGESEDLYDKFMEMSGWTVTDKEKENDLT